jgi:GAF domain
VPAPSIRKDSNPAHHPRAARLLLIILTVWALAMIAPGLQRVFDSLDSFGLSVDNDGIVTDIVAPFQSPSDSPAAAAGIVPGDRIALQTMRCIPPDTPQCTSLIAILGGLGGMHATLQHSQINLSILPQSGGAIKIVSLHSAPAPLNSAQRLVLFADTLVGIVVILIAFWLLWTRPSWMTWGLFLYVIWFNPGQSYTYYALLQREPVATLAQEIAESLAQGAAFAGLLLFALRFPEDRSGLRWEKLQWAVPSLAAAMAALTLLSFGSIFGFATEKITEFTFLAGYAIDAAVLYILLARRRTLPPQEKQRMNWVLWGCAIGLPAYILAELCQSSDLITHLWGAAPAPAFIGLLYLPNGVLAYFASQAVWQRRVVSVSIPLRHGTILVALSLALGIPIVQLHEKMNQLEADVRMPAWIWPLVVAPIVLLVMQRLHEIAVELLDRVFNRQFHSAHEQLKAAHEALVHCGTLPEIDCLLVESAVRALDLSSGAVFRNDGKTFRRTQDTRGWTASLKKELHPEQDSIALRCLKEGEPVRIRHDAWDPPGLPPDRPLDLPSGLAAPCLAVPVRSGVPEATAVALFGPHRSGNDITRDESEMLERLAARAALAYERVVTAMLRQQVATLRQQLAAQQPAAPASPAEK